MDQIQQPHSSKPQPSWLSEASLALSEHPIATASGVGIAATSLAVIVAMRGRSLRLQAAENATEFLIPILKFGEAAQVDSALVMSRSSPLAKLYSRGSESVGKIEIVRDTEKTGKGTAFAVRPGMLITNYHVIDDAVDISVINSKGRLFAASVVKVDKENDLALLQIAGSGARRAFKPLELGSNPMLTSGSQSEASTLVALGHPHGWNKLYLSKGHLIDSTQASPAMPLKDRINLAMNIAPGNSGGPLLDMQGKVVGVLRTGRIDEWANKESHAIPVETLRQFLPAAETTRERARAALSGLMERQLKEREYSLGSLSGVSPGLRSAFGDTVNSAHIRYQTVTVLREEKPWTVLLKAEYQRGSHEILVRPIRLNGTRLDATTLWPGTNTPMQPSLLRLSLGKDFTPTKLTSTSNYIDLLSRPIKAIE